VEQTLELTIDELARQTGMTARNIRAHQSRGLLPPPEVRGRTGYYGEDHVARIELIKEMQTEGFNLELIRKMIESANGSSAEVLGFTRALRAPFVEEEPQFTDAVELADRFGSTDPALLARAEKLGLLRAIGDGRFEEPSPRLADAGEALTDIGISVEEAMDIFESIRRHADSVSKSFVRIFMDRVWKPFDRDGRPEERWPEVRDALERLRPLASQSVTAVFQLAMDDAADKAWGRELERIEEDERKRRHRRR
jgi:DNA-binding transcriptional MerR regulator